MAVTSLRASEDGSLQPLPGYPCTVLLVDSDGVSADAVMALLEAEGCTVFPVPDLATAVRLLDLVVAGVILFDPGPLLGGDDTGGFGDLLHRAEGVPVVLFSHTDINESQARAAGFAAVVRKPFDVSTLVEAVRQAARIAAEYQGPPRRAPRGTAAQGGR